jgi:hypothetical protein
MPPPVKFSKESFVRNLAKGNLLAPYLERYDEWDHPFTFDYRPKEGDDGWHPSGDCTPPVMDLWEKAMGRAERETISPILQRAFLVGHFWHQVIQDALVRMEFAAPEAVERKGRHAWKYMVDEPETPWNSTTWKPLPYHYATGSGDVAPLVMPNWEGILDIKTMNPQSFDRLAKTDQLPAWAADKYECQLNIYMDFFDQPSGMILAVNKGNSQFAEIVYDRNQDLIDTIYAKFEYVSYCLDEGFVPDAKADEMFELPLTGPVTP